MNNIKLLYETIETLSVIQDEDRLVIFTLLGIMLTYLNDVDIPEEGREKQKEAINDILYRYNIRSVKDLKENMDICCTNLKNHKLISKPHIGGIQ